MKRKTKVVIALVCCMLIVSTFAFGACQLYVTIRFDENYDGVARKEYIRLVGETITPPTVTRDGFEFVGWYKDKQCTVPATDNDFIASKSLTFYAKWEEVVPTLQQITATYVGEDLPVGGTLSKADVMVLAHYSNGTYKEVQDFTLSEIDTSTAGDKTVTVTYVENDVTKTDTFTVTVTQPAPVVTLQRIEASYNGDEVYVGEQPDVSKLVVTAFYSDGTSKVVTNFNAEATLDSSTAGDKNWQISYTEDGVTVYCIVTITVLENEFVPGEPKEGTFDVNVIKNENLSIHFLELGNKYTGDSVYIKAGDTDILIDAGSRYTSASTITNYVNQYCTDGVLEYVIATHAHQDHIEGFVTNSSNGGGVLDRFGVENLIMYARKNSTSNISTLFTNKVNELKNNGTNIYTAKDCIDNTNGAVKEYTLADGITMEILDQRYYHEKSSNENNYSVCLMISQGDNHYLFTGDLEDDGEVSLVNSNPDLPEMELWKGGHHGSYTAANAALMAKIKPKCVCICTCMGTTEYTTGNHAFPAQEFCDRVAPYTDRVYVTTYAVDYNKGNVVSANGNIVFACTRGQITMYFSNNNLKLKDTDWFKANRTCPQAWK